MPVLIGLVWGGFISILGSIVGRVLVMLAISYVTYSGIDLLLDSVKAQAFIAMGNMGILSGVVGMLKLGESLNVVVSAVVAKFTIGGLTNGSVTRLAFKK